MRKSVPQHLWDALGAPLRMGLLSDDSSTRLGFTSLEEERMGAVLPELRGRLLDIGAGRNTLVRRWIAHAHGADAERARESVGVDVRDCGGGARIVDDASQLPFPDAAFDSVTLVASLHQIPKRAAVLCEAARLLRPGGRVVLTLIDPLLAEIGQRLGWTGADRQRGKQPGELGGMWARDVVALCEGAGFRLARYARFVYGLNQLFVGEKPEDAAPPPFRSLPSPV